MLVTWTLVPVNGPVPTSTWLAFSRTYPGVFAFETFPEMTDRFAWVALRPASAVESACVRLMAVPVRLVHAWSRTARSVSLDYGQQALHHLIGDGHHLRIRGIGLLRHHQLAELRGYIDVRAFKRVAGDGSGGREDRLPRIGGRRISAAAQRLQAVLTVEGRQRHLRHR